MSRSGEIALHAAAPTKPSAGAPCNGCGVCCALETCPLARLLFLKKGGPCPALHWHEPSKRYLCGLAEAPADYLPWLPVRFSRLVARITARSIAADSGCDCDAELLP